LKRLPLLKEGRKWIFDKEGEERYNQLIARSKKLKEQ